MIKSADTRYFLSKNRHWDPPEFSPCFVRAGSTSIGERWNRARSLPEWTLFRVVLHLLQIDILFQKIDIGTPREFPHTLYVREEQVACLFGVVQ